MEKAITNIPTGKQWASEDVNLIGSSVVKIGIQDMLVHAKENLISGWAYLLSDNRRVIAEEAHANGVMVLCKTLEEGVIVYEKEIALSPMVMINAREPSDPCLLSLCSDTACDEFVRVESPSAVGGTHVVLRFEKVELRDMWETQIRAVIAGVAL